MITVKIDRSKWLRGEGAENSYLLRSADNQMCCLGFVAKQLLGMKDDQISGVPEIEIHRLANAVPSKSYVALNNAVDELYTANDAINLEAHEREALLKEIAETIGLEFQFYDSSTAFKCCE